jgi:RHS repeat-associated protein
VSRDGGTGSIDASYDTAGLGTVFSYDSQGRVTSIAPPGEAATTVTYGDARTTTAVRAGSDDGSWQRILYDGLGRLIREIRQMPSGYAFRTHDFDAAGHESFASEWKSCASVAASGDCTAGAPGAGTTSSGFDPFGRAQAIRRADGSTTTISFTDGATPYSDTRKAVTIANVGCAWNGSACAGGAAATTAYRYDAFGRLVTVLEPGGDITTYSYDVAGKLVSVGQGSQTRTFAFDALGFRLRETTPEGGTVDSTAVSGGKTYAFTGSLGNPRARVDAFGTAEAITRSSRYDAAGRPLCEIAGVFAAGQTCDTSGLALSVRNFYDGQGFGGGSHPAGRLTQRVGYNRGLSPVGTVTEQFDYSAPSGRLSRQTTSTVAGSASHSAVQTWTYDAIGLVKTHGHPRASGTFTVTTGRSLGYVTSMAVPGQTVVSAATYGAAGALASWTAGNGVVTTITPDATLLPRASQIRTSGAVPTSAGGNFDSGIFRYDGAGNIVAIGTDAFAYDARSRLTSAAYAGLGSESYAYDRFGNLTSDGATTYCASTCTGNRLGAPYAYDARGNLKATASDTLTYDDLSRQIRHQGPGADWRYLYSGASERVAKLPAGGTPQYTDRDENHRVATEFFGAAVGRDNMYLGNLLVASYVSSSLAGTPGWEFYASDHLATPRLVTNLSGQVVDTRKYWPYGAGVAGNTGTLQKVRFCAMERDSENGHYYDHARMHDAGLRRFTSPDRVGGIPEQPLRWNRYAYSLSNPVRFVDPDGQLAVGFTGLGNSSKSGIHDLANTFAAHSGVGATKVFDWEARKQALAFIQAQLAQNPDQPVIVFGHSRGAAESLKLARDLKTAGVKVDLVLTIDPVLVDPMLAQGVPSNVRKAVNYYETQSMPFPGTYVTADSNETDVQNRRIPGVGHGELDDWVAADVDGMNALIDSVLERRKNAEDR